MVRIVTKEYYYSKTSGKDYSIYSLPEFEWFRRNRFSSAYLEYEGSVFVYLSIIGSVLVPKDQNLTKEELLKAKIEISDGWDLEFITKDIPKEYNMSKFMFQHGGVVIDDKNTIMKTNGSGKYILRCKNGDEICFYIKYIETFCECTYAYFSFDEKLEFPLDIRKIKDKTKLIESIIDDKFREKEIYQGGNCAG